jgi:dTMP kinase
MGKLIVFEGIDRSGKTTQMSRLKEYLESTNLTVWSTREPYGDECRNKIKTVNLSPQEQLDLILEDRRLHCDVIREKMSEFDIVLCDRFTPSTLAYQGYGSGIDPDILIKANGVVTGGLKPDMVIIFDLPIWAAVARLENRPLDAIERNILFLERVRWGYLDIAKRYNYHLINSNQSSELVFSKVVNRVLRALEIESLVNASA